MAASKANYLIIWKKASQVYSATSLETAVKTPVPKGCEADDKRILLATFMPDEDILTVYQLTNEEIQAKIDEIQLKAEEKQRESESVDDPA